MPEGTVVLLSDSDDDINAAAFGDAFFALKQALAAQRDNEVVNRKLKEGEGTLRL